MRLLSHTPISRMRAELPTEILGSISNLAASAVAARLRRQLFEQLTGVGVKSGPHFSNLIFPDKITLWAETDSNYMYRT